MFIINIPLDLAFDAIVLGVDYSIQEIDKYLKPDSSIKIPLILAASEHMQAITASGKTTKIAGKQWISIRTRISLKSQTYKKGILR